MQKSIVIFSLSILIAINAFGDESMATCPNERKHHEFSSITKSLVWTCLSEEAYAEEVKKNKSEDDALNTIRDENTRKEEEKDKKLIEELKQQQHSKQQDTQQSKKQLH